jgi:hypothetical protein
MEVYMLQIKTFADENDVNTFLKELPENQFVNIQYKIMSENDEDFSEYFMVLYRI